MAAHTPGPWKVECRFSNGCEITPRIICEPDADRECGWIADLIGAPYLGHESTLPNAQLIAAAPELLFQLQVCTEYIRLQWVRDGDLPTLYHDSVAAIAKAKGEL